MMSLLKNILIGAAAGCAATAPMTAAMMALHRQLPRRQRYPLPPRLILERLTDVAQVGDRAAEPIKQTATMAAHFGYGAAAGALYGAATEARLLKRGLPSGVGYGVGVWTVSYLALLPALGILRPATEHPWKRSALMIAAHLVWGAALGTIMAASDKYEQERERGDEQHRKTAGGGGGVGRRRDADRRGATSNV